MICGGAACTCCPVAFTVGNLLCGFYAVLATLQGGASQLDDAARAIGFAIVFDAFDGFVARMTHTIPSSANSLIRWPTW